MIRRCKSSALLIRDQESSDDQQSSDQENVQLFAKRSSCKTAVAPDRIRSQYRYYCNFPHPRGRPAALGGGAGAWGQAKRPRAPWSAAARLAGNYRQPGRGVREQRCASSIWTSSCFSKQLSCATPETNGREHVSVNMAIGRRAMIEYVLLVVISL